MTPTEAHARFCWIQDHDRDRLPLPDDETRLSLFVPMTLTGASMLSGGLPDLPDDASDDELCELAEHGISLVEMGVRSFDDWQDEIRELFDQLEAELEPHYQE